MATAPATRNQSPVGTLNHYFSKHKGQLAAALPKHLNPDRMIRLALTAFSQNKQLANCTPESIFASVIVASQLGLELGVAGQAYLVPYKNTCTCIPGWQGYVDLVSRSGRATVWTGAVFEGDEFDYALGSDPYVRHRPSGESDPSKLTHVYAIGRVNGSEYPVIEVWPIDRVWAHRDKNNKVGRGHYSFAHPEMYARKVPLLQVIKYMPKSIELQSAMEVDSAASQGKGAQFIDGEFMVVDNEEGEAGPAQEPPQIGDESAALNEQQLKMLTGKLQSSKKTEDQLLKAFEVKSLNELKASQIPDLLAWVEQ